VYELACLRSQLQIIKTTYSIFHREVKESNTEERGYDLRSTTVMSAFELANMNATRSVFPAVIIKGCLSHSGQGVERNLEDKWL